jgi:hypothetical protein
MTTARSSLPLVLAGPLLRRASPQQVVLWLAVREPLRVRITMQPGEGPSREQSGTDHGFWRLAPQGGVFMKITVVCLRLRVGIDVYLLQFSGVQILFRSGS